LLPLLLLPSLLLLLLLSSSLLSVVAVEVIDIVVDFLRIHTSIGRDILAHQSSQKINKIRNSCATIKKNLEHTHTQKGNQRANSSDQTHALRRPTIGNTRQAKENADI
jgi:hypothetical protein